ncbi:hypothetical protein OF83DRAFT_89415 [Amylostereum chailletii]|nr:hypothetical protein OF83DRAFT_89415 [Amylostereum chailletii]
MSNFMPHIQDIIHLSVLQGVVFDGVDGRARARVKASILSSLPAIRAWFRDRRDTLLLSLPDAWVISSPILSPFHTAFDAKVSIFDLCSSLQVERFDLAINVGYCVATQSARGDCGEILFGRQMFAHRCSSACRWPLPRVQPFYRASGFVRVLLVMLGLDVEKTTGEMMDMANGRFVCMDCAEENGRGRRERPWRDIVEHCVKAHALWSEGKRPWRLLEGGEKDYVERHPLATVADARWGSCGRSAHAKSPPEHTLHYLTTQE